MPTSPRTSVASLPIPDDFQRVVDGALQHVRDSESNLAAPEATKVATDTAPKGEVHFPPIGETEHQKEILLNLSTRTPNEDGKLRVHVGCAGGFNFSSAAVTRPDRMLFLDINPQQSVFLQQVVGLLGSNENPEDFVAAYKHAFSGDESAFNVRTGGDGNYPDGADWVVNRNSYKYLHEMAKKGHIATATMDVINDRGAASALGETFKNNGMRVDTAYWSNIGGYFQPYAIIDDVEVTTTRGGYTRERQKKRRVNALDKDDFTRQTDGTQLPEGGLLYPETTFVESHANGSNTALAWGSGGRRISPARQWNGDPNTPEAELPAFEKMLRTISAIGSDQHTTHMLTSATGSSERPLIMLDGPPRPPSSNWLNVLMGKVKEQRPNLEHEQESALFHYFEKAISYGVRFDGNQPHSFEQLAGMSANELEEAENKLKDKLTPKSRQNFTEAASKRSEQARWDSLFAEGKNEIYLPLDTEAHSLDDRIEAVIKTHNVRAEANLKQAKQDAADGKLPENKVGRDISQRQIRRDPDKVNMLQSYDSVKDTWQPAQKLGGY